ncbi:MAG: tRNA epoxyqueuosine(34) reductase QueG [Nitrospirae bacterium]|nr:MAG: tRNA epoxyqueuosine(34) reductase QueG [Nitrospirota bacterium]
MATLTEAIKQEAFRVGFDAVGIARIPDASRATSVDGGSSPSFIEMLFHRLVTWLARGWHATMEWMGKNPWRRSDPRLVLPGCRSIICVGLNYYSDHQPHEAAGYGRVARYAWGTDYHEIMDARLTQLRRAIQSLAPTAAYKQYVDTGPIMEKAWAQQAGLGWIGKHSNLVSPEFGSWLVLGEILTTLELEADEPGTDLCGSCSLCIQACPTGAIDEPYMVDATKCLSYWTIEFRGSAEAIPQDIQRKFGNHMFGCDDCLDICPYNVNARSTKEPAFAPSPLTLNPHLDTLRMMTEEEFRQTFRHSPIRRARYAGFQRNVQLARA